MSLLMLTEMDDFNQPTHGCCCVVVLHVNPNGYDFPFCFSRAWSTVMVTTFVSMATAVGMESAAHITMKSGVSISTLDWQIS